MAHFRYSKSVCFNLPTSVPVCSADPAFTLTTPNWKSVVEAVEISQGSNLYGPGPGPAPNSWLTLYTVPPNRLAILLTAAYLYSDQFYTRGANAAIRDVHGRFYLIADTEENVNWERFPLLDENDQFVVWNSTDDEARAVGASFIEFDKTLPCGSFYKILRFSTFSDKASAEYTIPVGHSAILCPNNLLGGIEGSSLAKTVIFGADTDDTSPFGVENVINSVTFFIRETVSSPPENGFITDVEHPKFTSFKAGDTFRIKYPAEGETPFPNGGLKTGQTALLVKPH